MNIQGNYQDILYERIGTVARIWHNRPLKRNAESVRLLEELDRAVREAEADPEVKVIVLAGKGDHFSAGHDLQEGQDTRKEFTVEERWTLEQRIYLDYCLRIRDLSKPTISQVQGACIAGGFMVANMCDLVVASRDAFFSDPVLHSLGAAAVEVLVHPYVLGHRLAKDMLFTGRRVSAEEAYQAGMISRIVDRADLETTTLELAQHIAKAPDFAMALTKRSLNRAMDMQGFRTAVMAHFDTHQLAHVSSEANRIREAGFMTSIATQRGR